MFVGVWGCLFFEWRKHHTQHNHTPRAHGSSAKVGHSRVGARALFIRTGACRSHRCVAISDDKGINDIHSRGLCLGPGTRAHIDTWGRVLACMIPAAGGGPYWRSGGLMWRALSSRRHAQRIVPWLGPKWVFRPCPSSSRGGVEQSN